MATSQYDTACACGAELSDDIQFFATTDGAIQCEDCLDAEDGGQA